LPKKTEGIKREKIHLYLLPSKRLRERGKLHYQPTPERGLASCRPKKRPAFSVRKKRLLSKERHLEKGQGRGKNVPPLGITKERGGGRHVSL